MNRRNSDLVDKADGVLYTSDGRDVEMSVASTKAFYAQVAAGLPARAARSAERRRRGTSDARRSCCRRCDAARRDARRCWPQRRRSPTPPQRCAPSRRYWAVVGNGANRIAADELRIKLSELCYKSIACDVTEDKKHIDLSSEPLILVCAAGLVGLERRRRRQGGRDLPGAQGRADRDRRPRARTRFGAALEVISVPAVAPDARRSCSSTMAGHLFGYEAALADRRARPPAARGRARDRGSRRRRG